MAQHVHLPSKHVLHSSYSHRVLQDWQGSGPIPKSSLVFPLFVVSNDDARQEIAAMPGHCRWGANRLQEVLDEPVARGLAAVILFGVIDDDSVKDGTASRADAADAPVLRAIARIRALYPRLLIICDLCLCGYTSHGHCGILKPDHRVDNAASIARLGEIAVSYALAGADVVAPSDMMDGRVAAIKVALRAAGLESRVPVMAYSAKYASCFYGPFRDAAHSGMTFGDRSLYQLPPGSRDLAVRALLRDVDEGADFVMVKPGMPYLDIVRDAAERVHVPIAVYQVSGEFAMLHHAAAAGALDRKRAVMESLTAFRRAGASIYITYFAPEVLRWCDEDASASAGAS